MSASGGSTVASAPPTAANVTDGYALQGAAATVTLVTIPAGRTWIGQVGCSSGIDNPAVTARGAVFVTVGVAGAGAVPVAGDYIGCTSRAPATVTGSTIGSGGQNEAGPVRLVVVAPVGNAVTITTTLAVGGTATNVTTQAWATGELQ